jgi:tRNA G18 (ribose-2'-O)-methylase SpoU
VVEQAGMKGYFGIGVERISKAANVGTLFRTAHAFGASFIFTVASQYRQSDLRASDTADTPRSLPLHEFADVPSLRLPRDCRLVGIELTEDAVELPSFRHPRQAAYILGSEREGLSAQMQQHCDHIIRIPMRFSVNLAVAGAIVMYDRLIQLGRFAPRPVAEGGPTEGLPEHVFGEPVYMRKRRRRAAADKN